MEEVQSTVAHIACVGCQHRVKECRAMMEDPNWDDHMYLQFEPENPYDTDAIAFKYKSTTVGYIPAASIPGARELVGKIASWRIVETCFMDSERTILKWVTFEVTY